MSDQPLFTPELTAAHMLARLSPAVALGKAREALRYHQVNRNPVSTFFWASTIDLMKKQA